MNNLISIYMNYQVSRLVEYAVVIQNEDNEFVRSVFSTYFQMYIDNYYYELFHTVDADKYSVDVLKKEFVGIMQDLLDDYRQYELEVSNEEYAKNLIFIRKAKELCLEIIKIDQLTITNKDDIPNIVQELIDKNVHLKDILGDRVNKLISRIRETYLTNQKLLNYNDSYFRINRRKFEGHDDIYFYELEQQVKILDNYKKMMVSKVYQENELYLKKLECLVQKISLELLRDLLEKKKSHLYIIEIDNEAISRGRIIDKVYDLINNPLLQKYVVLGVDYNTYLNQKDAFVEDFIYACIQDYAHINDIYQKTENILNEGVFDYLVVYDYKFKDKDFFTKYENNAMEVLLFEEG